MHEMLRRRANQSMDISRKIALMIKDKQKNDKFSGYSLDRERRLLCAIHKGDMKESASLLSELLAGLYAASTRDFELIRCRAMELMVLIARTAIKPGYNPEALLWTNHHHYKLISEASNLDELIDILYIVTENFASRNFYYKDAPHASALKRAERFIWENYQKKITLNEAAEAAGLSPAYFSTVFKQEMGESFSQYLNRFRIEAACSALLNTELDISNIAQVCGYDDSSWFSKIFKSQTGMSPAQFRKIRKKPIEESANLKFSPGYMKAVSSSGDRSFSETRT
jgi:AraC-like DNA-binding protein